MKLLAAYRAIPVDERVVTDGKIMVHEENIVIRDGPPTLLTRRAPPELPIL